MENGLLILGLNGCGKTTVGRIISEKTGLFRADAEDYYFPDGLDGAMRMKSEAERVLAADIASSHGFVLSSVTADWSREILGRVTLAVLLSVPADERLHRIRQRSLGRFGARALPGGDRYEAEEAFFAKCAVRTEEPVRESLKALSCPVLRPDAIRTPEEIADEIIRYLEE